MGSYIVKGFQYKRIADFMEWPKGLQTSLNASVNKSGASDKSSPVGFYEIVKGFNIKKSLAFKK